MKTTMRWFDRKFDFAHLHEWMFPALVERLRGTPARVADIISGLPADVLTRRDDNQWSIQEHVGHLLDLEPLFDGRLDDFLAEKETLRPADLENRRTHDANHNAASLDELLAALRSTRARLVSRLESLDNAMAVRAARHPRLDKPMRVIDSMYFHAEHDDHHLAMMSEIIRKL